MKIFNLFFLLFKTNHKNDYTYLFSPWGYTYNLPSDYTELMRVANIGKDAIQRVNGMIYLISRLLELIYKEINYFGKFSGVKFVTGSSTHLLYVSSGGSEDWAKGTLGIKYAYW